MVKLELQFNKNCYGSVQIMTLPSFIARKLKPYKDGIKSCISQIYYTHGLFCASHPYSIITGVIITVMIICYPLANRPHPGNAPVKYTTPLSGYTVPPRVQPLVKSSERHLSYPRWYVGKPEGYIQQIVVKATVSPWKPSKLTLTDSIRAPVSLVFQILDAVNNFQTEVRGEELSVADICLRVSEVVTKGKVKGMLPEYSCLILSPANLWQNQENRFTNDGDILKTIYRRYGQALETPPNLKDLLFGVPWGNTGISRYFSRTKERPIMFAITIITKKYDPSFTQTLRMKLESLFPETSENVNNTEKQHIVHFHYKDIDYVAEYTYLFVAYFAGFLYLYFSAKKIEMVKSKWGLAVSAVAMVIASLLVSVSICTLFGMRPQLNGSEIFPYLVIIIGVENVVVLTKSIVSTPVHLDVKIRVAQGLSKEGWYITKNLFLELVIILIGLFTYVPAIQEFCLFAVVGILSDFCLQVFFFVTVLSVDIRRMELTDLHKQRVLQSVKENDAAVQIEPLYHCPVAGHIKSSSKTHSAKSVPNLDLKDMNLSGKSITPPPSPGADDTFFPSPAILELPRRLKFLYFWAKTRMFQRMIMFCTFVWIVLIFYKTGLVDKLTNQNHPTVSPPTSTADSLLKDEMMDLPTTKFANEGLWGMGRAFVYDDLIGPVEHTELELFNDLSYDHWPTLFGHYNISLFGHYVSILPTIHLSSTINPDMAVNLRHSSDSQSLKDLHSEDTSKPIKQADTLTDEAADDISHYMHMYDPEQLKLYYPKSQKEFFITVCFAILTVIVITYFMVVMYKCMCSRNYAKWRTSWNKFKRQRRSTNRFIKESIPLVLKGHSQDIECLLADVQIIISACLGGELRVWDSNSGELISTLHRNSITPPRRRKPCLGRNIEDSDADLYAEYHGDSFGLDSTGSSETSLSDKSGSLEHSRKFIFDNEPDLSSTICCDFKTPDPKVSKEIPTDGQIGYDFQSRFGKVYEEHWQLVNQVEPMPSARDSRIKSQESSINTSGSTDWENSLRTRSWSAGDSPFSGTVMGPPSAIWCLASDEGLVVVGCGNGRVEVWEAESGLFKCQYEMKTSGVTALSFSGKSVIVARLDGSIDFLHIETFHNPVPQDELRKQLGHVRSMSEVKTNDIMLRLVCQSSVKAHQRPINFLQSSGGRVVSACQDHTLKVFRMEDCLCLYTFYGHEGSITALYLDKLPPYGCVSGSTDKCIRLWDLVMGSCLNILTGHEGTVCNISCTVHHVISIGVDDKLCIWDRYKGFLLHSITVENCCGSNLCLFSNSVFICLQENCCGSNLCLFSNSVFICLQENCCGSNLCLFSNSVFICLQENCCGSNLSLFSNSVFICLQENCCGSNLSLFSNSVFICLQENCCGSNLCLFSNSVLSVYRRIVVVVIYVSEDKLYLCDIVKGKIIRQVQFSDSDQVGFVRKIQAIGNMSIVCDFGKDLQIIHFPTILEKRE
ncbi:hypothetical protein LOTGIDRAFT_239368 [Lottia gigantea]|uniref:Sterol regulatory element-binding protein cleavage-activating protein n=1 Tax=Lottia gigantea TaxID=225164 RepID=V4AN66_LOTGI|nr:hypothetical protein LOTGIDRAFT_239368 [Lottia gigantea]ESO96220.1 hypothetical protein LOTGIDRAFT_239368 [Lottia gigantea]